MSFKKKNKDANTQVVRETIEAIFAEPDEGLSREQAEERARMGWANLPVNSGTKSVKEIIKSNVFTYFNMIFIILAALLAVVGSYRDMMFMGVIICNTVIGIVQEIRSKRVLDKLNILNAAHSTVIRDGEPVKILTEELVIDDIIELSAGSQIPADAEVVRGSVQVNEALITGESEEISKGPGKELLSGSFVISGSCRARLTKVGRDSYISRLTLQATAQKGGEQSEMMRDLNRLVKIAGIIIIPIGGLLFYQQFQVMKSGFAASVTNMVSALIGMIPEGLYLTASVAMAVSAGRLAMKKVLLHDMKSIETLARVTVLCVDKTGTITEDHMEVKDFRTGLRPEGVLLQASPNRINQVLESGMQKLESMQEANVSPGACPDQPGEEQSGPLNVDLHKPLPSSEGQSSASDPELRLLLGDFVRGQAADNATMRALKEYFTEGAGREPEKVFPFSSKVKYSAAVIGGRNYVLGAPEFLLGDDYELYQEFIETHGESGYRVLAFGSYDGELTGQPLTRPIRLLGTVLLANRVRAGAVETFRYFAERDVRIKVISGDNPVSVSAIAREAGIENAEDYVDASSLKTPEDIEEAIQKYTVFGRVTPDQKRQFVKALQSDGETVAMTGDGVNDVLALKDADCSIAMASGSEAASQVAQLVLLDSDFSKMPDVVLEGRRVVNNIQRTASLFLVKNIFSLLLSVFSVILLMDYPLEAKQISLISMFTIGIPAFILSQEPNKDPIRGHFLSNVLLRALPAGLTDFLVVFFLVQFCQVFGVDDVSMSTACTLLVALVGFMIMYRIMMPMTKIHWAILLSMIAGLIFCFFNFQWWFGIQDITSRVAMLMLLFAIAAEPLMRYLSMFAEWLLHRLWRRPDRKKPAKD